MPATCVMCPAPADGVYTWGRYDSHAKGAPRQRAALCRDHAAELWAKVGPSVSLGDSHFVVEPPYPGAADG